MAGGTLGIGVIHPHTPISFPDKNNLLILQPHTGETGTSEKVGGYTPLSHLYFVSPDSKLRATRKYMTYQPG